MTDGPPGTPARRRGRRLALGAGAVATAGAAAAAGAVAFRAGARRLRVGPADIEAAGLGMPADVTHHHLPVSDGGRLHVVERGEGPPIVLVHGVTLSSAVFPLQLRHLGTDHRVVAVDQRGHGESRGGSDGYTIDRLADDLLEVLAALDIRRGVLAGHSMGGMVSLRVACQRPAELRERVSALALIGTSAGPVVRGPGHRRTAAWFGSFSARGLDRVQRLGRQVLPEGDMGVWLARAAFGAHPLAADVELTRSVINRTDPAALGELMATLLAFDVSRDIGTIELPTTVMVGTRDVLTPPRMARALRGSIPNSQLVTLPGAGHMLMLERAEEVNELLHEISKEAAGAPTG